MAGREGGIRRAGLLGVLVALAAALAFFGITAVLGGYPPVARYGGAAWVFLLTWIITMPVLAPLLKARS
ncbi:MAG: hypothetical protein QN141_05290 [Armatimonadota bacterium]|nr:hypothetical protein [Armatimonadota bacterium]MDR7451327.1 hypothetical protein [Armatimonadota bacterium]MDR7466769.1 hypothetical protein [Armatimonadota bacterium]MDR7492757.1 hypothetical protein [Armatimonadota bacterium]MDR7498533.1 hypothetical protein [Armatimonadota bacterium]